MSMAHFTFRVVGTQGLFVIFFRPKVPNRDMWLYLFKSAGSEYVYIILPKNFVSDVTQIELLRTTFGELSRLTGLYHYYRLLLS